MLDIIKDLLVNNILVRQKDYRLHGITANVTLRVCSIMYNGLLCTAVHCLAHVQYVNGKDRQHMAAIC